MLSTSDTISLLMGIGSISLAILTSVVTFVARKPARHRDATLDSTFKGSQIYGKSIIDGGGVIQGAHWALWRTNLSL
ncbi:hypothetical protein V8E51_007214 [Hyaloscypha variabilis]